MLIINKILGIIWFISLLGVANMSPVLLKKLPFLNIPVDFGKNWRKERLFGKNKTWRGFFCAPIIGGLFFLVQKFLYVKISFLKEISLFNYQEMTVWFGVWVGLGVIVGDLVKSFFKRRWHICPGKSWLPFDQIDFILGGLIVALCFYRFKFLDIIFIIIIGFCLHLLVKFLGYILKIDNKPI